MVALAQPVGPIKNKRINLKKMLPIRYLCRHDKSTLSLLKSDRPEFYGSAIFEHKMGNT